MLADNSSGQLGLGAKSRLSSQGQQEEWPAEDTKQEKHLCHPQTPKHPPLILRYQRLVSPELPT